MGVATSRLLSAWVVVIAGVTAALHIGKLPPALPALQAELGVSLVQAGWLLSLVQLAGMLLGLVIGTTAEGMGLRRSMLLGLAIVTVAGTVGGFVHDVTGLLVLRAVEGVGVLLATVPAPALLRRLLHSHHVTRMLGVWGAYVPAGTGIALFLGAVVVQAAGWPAWWWLVAASTALLGAAVALLVPDDAQRQAPADRPVERRGASMGERVAATLGARAPWFAALVFGLYASQWMTVIGFLPTLYAQAGWVGTTGAVLTGVVPLVNVVGNLAAGWALHHRVPPAVVLVFGLGGQALGSFLAFAPVTGDAPVVRYAGALVFSAVGGLVPGGLFALAPLVAPTERTVSTAVGFVQQLSSFGQVVGPPVVAWLVGVLGGWHVTWAVTLACAALGAACAVGLEADLRRRRAWP